MFRFNAEAVATVPDARGLAFQGDVAWAPRFRSPDAGGVVYRPSTDTRAFDPAPDASPDSDTDARGLPTHRGAVAIRTDGRALVVAGAKQNMDRGLVRDGRPMTFETA